MNELLQSYAAAGFHLVPIPPINNKPVKKPIRPGWNLPYADDNPNGYTSNPSELAACLASGWNIGLALLPSGVVSFDIDDAAETRRIFDGLGLPLDEWVNDPGRVEIISGKPNKGKLLFRVVGDDLPPSVKLNFGKHPSVNSIFEIRRGSRDGKTLQDVLPPSIHPDTQKPYKLVGDVSKMPAIPPELLHMWVNWDSWAKSLHQFDPTYQEPEPVNPRRGRPAVKRDGERDAIAEFNAAYSLEAVLERNGYRRKGKRYIRPHSASGVAAVSVFENGCCYSHGGDDLNDGFKHDAFDVFRILECGGDKVKAMGWNPELTRHNRRKYMLLRQEGQTKPANERTSTVPEPYQQDIPPMDEDFFSHVPEAYQSGTSGTHEKDKPIHQTTAEPLFKLLSANEFAALPPTSYRIKNILPDTGLAAIFGPSGSGKSFLALDMAGAVCTGREWFGYRVKPGPVVYIACEGAAGMRKRIAAYRTRHGGQSLGSVSFLTGRVNLLSADVESMAEAIREKGLIDPVIVIDTLNRAAPGADENSSVDMGKVIDACSRLQAVCGGLVLLIHHCGKDSTKGMRGHSSLFAALDAAVEVKGIDDSRSWTLAKSKDGEGGLTHGFSLESVYLGDDEDGDAITSCVVGQNAARQCFDGVAPRLTTAGTAAMRVLEELYSIQESNLAAGGFDVKKAKVRLDDWNDEMKKSGIAKNRACDGRKNAKDAGFAIVDGGYVYIGDAYQRTSTVPDSYQRGTPKVADTYRTSTSVSIDTGTVVRTDKAETGESPHNKPVNEFSGVLQ